MAQREQRGPAPEKESGALEETARALRHPLRVQILVACHQRDLTPKEFAQARKISVPTVSYHFRALEKAGYIQVVREESVRGARRYVYRAKQPGVITTEEFAQAGPEAQRAASLAVVRSFFARCVEAIGRGTFDARPDSHLAWSPMEVDEQGWEELMSALDGIFKLSCEIKAEAEDRLRTSGETPIPVTFALAGFLSPAEDAVDREAP
jgi:DNA-binding transcriptional ArsR family regulator